MELAAGSYYPQGMNVDFAFRAELDTGEDDTFRQLSVSIVFVSLAAANNFVARASDYAKGLETAGLTLLFLTALPSFYGVTLFREKMTILLLMILLCGMSNLIHDGTSYLDREDVVFQYQRVEEAVAFTRAEPESSHIFPKAKFLGKF